MTQDDVPLKAMDAPLCICPGEPAGIGPEIILKAWLERMDQGLPAFAVAGGAEHLASLASMLGMSVPVETVSSDLVCETFEHSLPVIELPDGAVLKGQPNRPDEADATAICGSITFAVAGCMKGSFGGMVTAPINKKALYDSGFEFPGHTEFLADLARQHTGTACHPVMMIAGPQLRTVPVTIHIPLHAVPEALSVELIEKTCRIVASDLQSRFGISKPRLAVSGLNPHAGEGGALGEEDATIIEPALDLLRRDGLSIVGPLPADTMFHASARQTYDAAICMYHDQALIPAKTLAFDDAVNVTLGLPFIRTSPDHGTAYDIAGKGVAHPSSMIAAIKLAGEMAARTKASAGREAKA